MLNYLSPKVISVLFTLLLVNLMYTASAQTHHKKTTAKSHKKKAAPSVTEQGKSLIANSNCLSCHKLDIKLIGPAFKDIAAKYPANEANYDQLSKKVIAGGSGNWGEVPMSAHPDIKPDDAKKMVTYILSVK
jgi:cytochrome c